MTDHARDARQPMTDERFDLELRRVLAADIARISGAPSRDDLIDRLRPGTSVIGPRRERPSLGLVFAVLALLAAIVATVAYVGSQPSLLVMPTSSPATVVAGPSACTGATIDIRAANGEELPSRYGAVTSPEALVAFVHEESDSAGSVIVAGGNTPPRLVATVTGHGLQTAIGVEVIDWSADGSMLLLGAAPNTLIVPDQHCGDLFLVAADGSAVSRIRVDAALNTGGGWTGDAALSPSGETVAIGAEDLQLLSPGGSVSRGLDQCERSPRGLAWSPTGSEVLVLCRHQLLVVAADGSKWTSLTPEGRLVLGARWSADGRSIFRVDAVEGSSALESWSIDAVDHLHTPGPTFDSGLDWETASGQSTVSPDGRWLVGRAQVRANPQVWESYAIDLTTGIATRFPFQVATNPTEALSVGWHPDGRLLFQLDGILYTADLETMTQTGIGRVSMPSLNVAWHPLRA